MSLEVKKLGFYHDKEPWLFKDINLIVEPGHILGIFGQSGCGKTSLSKVLAGFLQPKAGHILVDNLPLPQKGFRPVQLIQQHPEKTMNPLWVMKKSLEEAYSPQQDLLAAFGIQEKWLNRRPSELSGGELQRFSIVRSLHPSAKYLIADEMTTMLDSITQASVWKSLLAVVKERNIGLILISHDFTMLEKICDRCYLIEENRFINMGNMDKRKG
ncbi:ABC transporter ATP-binding protein [Streptococcus pseudoporcinus]|uniref:Dipeptide transport ATP-binding protein DppF (TC 3.A.1.5.2) n=1 Tax=Streptococcus pseudoporcinus TaxID=361101 RepID=A0A4V6KZD5_9STRE|nr:ATP-binding cassette domain-containing protein [Streptococcus pseudoporcinus]VTS12457.1 Dipeptide transport ATP-binding protein DppF (TC 3.A.1.5.2) [Streptococcus pseudoporcinus]VUC64984.1 Dipeptide transport ATP-binding protein DppF (TC 3.A.1.5.2) [Streptococcus pseudoporcinus]VUC95652.1 Dipeptide transport ATP-binding protein DppF (TC 3.A.1.5.2) [Streptococcus pseudoporcinus]VUC96046.1 Dipeptide transport ATP-binding protein DppF (TC 3.A.1.5.2) [Streptococcus pseudoporcinus]